MEEYKNKLKGIWIPEDIWLNTELNLMEKIMLFQIKSLDSSARGCFAGNSYFADLFDITKGRCSQIITSLKNKGYLTISVKLEGKQVKERNIKVVNKLNTPYRILKGVFNLDTGGIKNIKGGCLENAQGNSISFNNIINSIDELKEKDFDFILKSGEFKKYLSDSNLEIVKKEVKKESDINYDDVLSFFINSCPNLQKPQKITTSRKSAINARAKDYDFKTIGAVFEKVGNSEFLNGNNKTGWKATFDWILNPNNFTKIKEDNYGNKDTFTDNQGGATQEGITKAIWKHIEHLPD